MAGRLSQHLVGRIAAAQVLDQLADILLIASGRPSPVRWRLRSTYRSQFTFYWRHIVAYRALAATAVVHWVEPGCIAAH